MKCVRKVSSFYDCSIENPAVADLDSFVELIYCMTLNQYMHFVRNEMR